MLPTKCNNLLPFITPQHIEIASLTLHKDEVWLVKFSASGNRLATAGKDSVLMVWNLLSVYADHSSGGKMAAGDN